jgi:hypothetical protein
MNDVLRHRLEEAQGALMAAILNAAEGLMILRDVDARVAELEDKKL